MPLRFDVDTVGAHITTLDGSTRSLATVSDSTSRLTRFGVQPWCGAVTSKIGELQSVTSSTIALLRALRTQILASDVLSPAGAASLGANTKAALDDLIRDLFGSQAEDLTVDDLVDWAQEHPEWLPQLVDVLPYTTVDEAAETAAQLDPETLVDWWQSAPVELRDQLIDAFPGLMGLLLKSGAKFTDAELDHLEDVVKFSVSTISDAAGVEVQIPTTKVDLGLDGTVTLAVETLSDGTALVHVIGDATLSAVLAAKSYGTDELADAAEVAVTAGLGADGQLTFKFDGVDEANAAVKRVTDAVAAVASATRKAAVTRPLSTLFPGLRGVAESSGKNAVKAAGALTDALGEFTDRLDNVQAEVSASVVGTGSISVDEVAAASAELGVEVTGLRSDQIGGDDDYSAVRIEVSASAEARVDTPWFLPGDESLIDVAASGSAALQINRNDDGSQYVVFEASYSATADGSAPSSTVHDISLTVPVNDATSAIVQDAIDDVGAGNSPVDTLSALDDHATIEVRSTTVQTGRSSTGLFGNNVFTEEHSSATDSIRRRGPDGEWYSPSEIADQIDTRR